jgi:hypothetical protein
MEMHVLMSAAKPLTSWLAQFSIQDCREACGGHGYLKGTIIEIILIQSSFKYINK